MNTMIANTTNLSERAGLVGLNLSLPQMRKTESDLSRDIEGRNETKTGLVLVSKRIIEDDLYDKVKSLAGRIRNYYYDQTLPWSKTGLQILPMRNYIQFTEGFRELKNEFEVAVENFLAAYPAIKESSKIILGRLYKESDYPSIEDLRSRLSVSMSFYPLPSGGDFRWEIPQEDMDQIKEEIRKETQRELELAHKKLWKRLHVEVKAIVLKLGNEKTVFHKSLITNLRDIVELVPRLNVMEDSTLDGFARQCKSIAETDPQALRDNPSLRSAKAEEATEIMKSMEDFM